MSALRDKHKQYAEYSERWELCEALFGGEHCVHEEGDKYLPRLQDEDDQPYHARLKMTPVFGAFPRTVLGLRGMMFRKPMVVEVPPAVVGMLEDINLAGTTFQGLAQEVVEDALVTGRVGLLVDYPQVIPGSTKADAAALNYRPKIVKYDAKAIYNWRTERVGSVTKLSQVRLEEPFEEVDPEDEFKVKCEKRYRVLDLVNGKYRQRLYKVEDGEETLEEDFFPQMNGKPLTSIPFVVIGVDCINIDVEAPPLIDLATTVLHHYQQATSYERGCFFSGLPTMFISGVKKDNPDGTPLEISIGGNLANILTNPDSKAYYVEVVGKFESLRTNLEDKKKEMAVLGARMLEAQKAGVEAAETVARRMSGEESLLSIMAQTISAGLTTVLRIFVEWAAAKGNVSVDLNRDFLPAGLTPQDAIAFMQLRDGAAISQEVMFGNLKAGEIIPNDVTFEEEQERISSALVGLGAPLAPELLGEPTEASPEATAAQPDVEAILQTMADQHQAVLDQILQAIQAQAPIPATLESMPETRMERAPAQPDMIGMMQMMGSQHAESMAVIAEAIAKEQPAATITVAAPIVTVEPAAITVEAPVVTVEASPVTVNMPEQPITITVPEQPVTVNNFPPESKKEIVVKRDSAGKITGAIAE